MYTNVELQVREKLRDEYSSDVVIYAMLE